MKPFFLVTILFVLITISRGQYEMNFGGRVPQSAAPSPTVEQKSNNIICLNVEITQNILVKGFEYYVSKTKSDGSLIANFLRYKTCNDNCANSLSTINNPIQLGALDTISQQFYRLHINKTGFIRDVLPQNEIQFIPKGSILGLAIGQNDASVLAIDNDKSNFISDRFAIVVSNSQSITLRNLKDGENWRYMIRAIGNPVTYNSEETYNVGWNIGTNWDSALIPSFTPYSGSYIIATINMPENSLITGFNIHTQSEGQIKIKFISFTECLKPMVDCVKYLQNLTLTSQALSQSDYHIRSAWFKLDLISGLFRYDLTTPFFADSPVFILLDQSEGGRVSIDTSNPDNLFSDYSFDARRVSKLSGDNDRNWKFTIRAQVVPFKYMAGNSTIMAPSKLAMNFLILLALMITAKLFY